MIDHLMHLSRFHIANCMIIRTRPCGIPSSVLSFIAGPTARMRRGVALLQDHSASLPRTWIFRIAILDDQGSSPDGLRRPIAAQGLLPHVQPAPRATESVCPTCSWFPSLRCSPSHCLQSKPWRSPLPHLQALPRRREGRRCHRNAATRDSLPRKRIRKATQGIPSPTPAASVNGRTREVWTGRCPRPR